MPIRVLFIGRYDIAMHNIRPEAEMIIGLARQGFAVTVMTAANCYYANKMAEAGIEIIDFVPQRKFSWQAIRRIRRALVEGRHDVIHLFNNMAIVNGIFASVGLPVKVVTYRGQTGNIYWYDPSCYFTHLSPRVDCIVCVADAVRASLAGHVRDASKLITIYKGHDLDWYRSASPIDRSALGVPADAFLIGCAANNRPRKGVPVLIDAVDQLGRDTNIHVVLIGGGMDSGEIAARIAASPNADRFHVLGYRDDVLDVIAACDAAVLPSIKREGLPKTVIEAMALGKPPIVTATGGSPELVDTDCGIVVPPGDAGALAAAMTGLAADPSKARSMGELARQRLARDFSLEASIDAHASLYRQLCGVH